MRGETADLQAVCTEFVSETPGINASHILWEGTFRIFRWSARNLWAILPGWTSQHQGFILHQARPWSELTLASVSRGSTRILCGDTSGSSGRLNQDRQGRGYHLVICNDGSESTFFKRDSAWSDLQRLTATLEFSSLLTQITKTLWGFFNASSGRLILERCEATPGNVLQRPRFHLLRKGQWLAGPSGLIADFWLISHLVSAQFYA